MANASPKVATAIATVFSLHRFVALSFGVILFAFPEELNEAMAPSKVMVFEEKFSLQVGHARHRIT